MNYYWLILLVLVFLLGAAMLGRFETTRFPELTKHKTMTEPPLPPPTVKRVVKLPPRYEVQYDGRKGRSKRRPATVVSATGVSGTFSYQTSTSASVKSVRYKLSSVERKA